MCFFMLWARHCQASYPVLGQVLLNPGESKMTKILTGLCSYFGYVGVHVLYVQSLTVTKLAEFANSLDPDEAAHNELPHLGLHCLLCSL